MILMRKMIMKKRTMIVSLIGILSAMIIISVFAVVSGRKPYKNLETVQIISAEVQLSPPNITIQITEIKEYLS